MDQPSAAETLWQQRQPLAGTLAAKYLNLTSRSAAALSKSIGFSTFDYFDLPDVSGPIAAIRNPDGILTGVQRTFLRPGTSDPLTAGCRCTACSARPVRQIIGKLGYGAIQLGQPGDTLGLAETVEEALRQSRRYSIPVWASAGAGRMQRVQAPQSVNHLILFMSPRLVESGWADAVRAEQASYVERVSIIIEGESHGPTS
jgi:hypothetical protein